MVDAVILEIHSSKPCRVEHLSARDGVGLNIIPTENVQSHLVRLMPPKTLHHIRIQGFKSIRSITLDELRPVNIVIGANGSGKSNLLGAFAFLREIAAGRLFNYVGTAGGADKILHFGSKTTETISLRVCFDNAGARAGISAQGYDLTLSPTVGDGLFPSREEIRFAGYPTSLIEWQQGREAGVSNLASEVVTKGLRQGLDQWRLYHLHDTSYMRKTARVPDKRSLRADGSNLSAFLYHLRENWADSYNLIVRTVQRVAPFFDNFELNPMENTDNIQLEWRHKGSDLYFDASQMSDGTLRFIALATLFLQPVQYRSSLILVDEPELGLHPYAIELLAALIRQAAVDTQIIVSTQSSLLLDHFEPEHVLVADRVDGATQLTSLDSARLAKWLEDYSLGQLWEKNEFGGRPGPR
jgi:predicted ATPase